MEFENKDIEIKGDGIRVHVLSRIFVILGVIAMIASFIMIRQIYNRFDEMRESNHYIETEKETVISFKTASDYLTEQAMKYVATGDEEYALNYFMEKNELKTREQALESVSKFNTLAVEDNLLHDAMKQSEALVVVEIHAMKLRAAANGDKILDIPEIAQFTLTEEEKALDPDMQCSKAISILFSKDYENYKNRINWDVDNAVELVNEEASAKYRENQDGTIIALNLETAFIFVMFILLVLIFMFTAFLVVRPVDKFVDAFDKQEKLPEVGGYEFRKFARRYNRVFRSDKKNRELLRERGEIDELTNTLKVVALDLVKGNLSQTNEPLGLLLVDIDNFRSIKEAYGYEAADCVIAKVARLFSTSFKSSDYIVRISQDQFEVFLLRMTDSDSKMLVDRIAEINEQLKDTSDGTVAASVSVGAAFGANGYDENLEKAADMALNNVKENGRGYCKIAEFK